MGREDPVIKYRKWTHKKLSLSVGVVCQSNRNRLIEILSTFTLDADGISPSKYKFACVEKFIIDIPNISAKIHTVAKNPTEVKGYRESLFKIIKNVNPHLNPNEVYISDNNTLTLLKTEQSLIDCPAWTKKEEDEEQILDAEIIYRATDRSEDHTYIRHTVRWKTVGYSVTVKQFNRKSKVDLVFGFEPKNKAQQKLYFVALCIDNLHALLQYLQSNTTTADLSPSRIINELHEFVLEHNPWVRMRLPEFKKINREFTSTGGQQEASINSDNPTLVAQAKAFTRLDNVPKKKILDLESKLKTHIFGQDETVEAVCKRVKKAYMGLKRARSPIGVFLFFGGTSTGKTEFSRALAKELTNSETSLIRIDCNTLQQDADLSVLLGSAPGYVGYDEGGVLSGPVLENKFRIVLFDEAEKASKQLFDFILTIIDEGQTLDRKGNLVDFSNCIFIFTSNIGQKEAIDVIMNRIGFSDGGDRKMDSDIQKREFKKILKEKLKPEFISRLKVHGGYFYFKELTRESLIQVANKSVKEMTDSLVASKTVLEVADNVTELLVDKVLEKKPQAHARDIIAAVDEEIINPLTDQLLESGFVKKGEKQTVTVTSTEDGYNMELIK